MTFVPVCARAPGGERDRPSLSDDRLRDLIRLIPGESDVDTIVRTALETTLYTDSREASATVSHAIASGMLVSRSTFVKKLKSGLSRHSTGAVGAVGILSSGRWRTVAATAGGILADPYFREHGIPRVICDDSGTQPGQELGSLAGQAATGSCCRLIGRTEREHYLEILLDRPELRGINQEALRFGLAGGPEWGFAAGANRNWWLLETSGTVSTLIDEDEGPGALFSHENECTAASSRFQPLRFQPHPGGDVQAEAATETSFIHAQDEVIGQSATALLTGADCDIDLSSCRGELTHSLLELDPTVVVCAAGVAGHPGWGSRRMIWHLEGEDRQRTVEDKRAYRTMSKSPSVFWSARGLTIAHSPFFRAGCASYDGTEALPLFPPVGRGEDTILGLVIHKCFAAGSIAHVPIAVEHRHLPVNERDPFEFLLSTNDFLGLAIQDYVHRPSPGQQPADMFEALGAHLSNCAAVPTRHFTDFVLELSSEQARAEYAELQALLERHRGPVWWARDVRKRQASIDRYFTRNIVDVGDVTSGEWLSRVMHVQRAIGMYGELLQIWATVFRAARELRASGRQPSRPLFPEEHR